MKIDPRCLDRNNWMGLYCIAHGYMLWGGVGSLSLLAWTSPLPLALRVLLVAVCSVVAGMGMFHVTTLAHEGLHGCLNKNRYVSMTMGVVASSAVPMFASVGYSLRHWHHHLYTNTFKDPDFADYHEYPTFLGRVSMGALASGYGFLRNLAALLFTPSKVNLQHYPFSLAVARRYGVLNVFTIAGFMALHVSVALWNPLASLFVLVLPGVVATCYLGMVPFIDHADTDMGRGVNARTYTSPFFTLLLLGTNYHREHHLHPSVPAYKLIGLHHQYLAAGEVPSMHVIEPGFFAALKIGATRTLGPETVAAGGSP